MIAKQELRCGGLCPTTGCLTKAKQEPQNNGLVIRINADDSAMVDYIQDGTVLHKRLSVIDIITALKQSSYTKCVINSGFLPKNCIAYSRDIENDDCYYVFEHTQRKSDIFYHNSEYKDFPLPRLIFGFNVSGEGKIRKVNVTVADEKGELNEETQLYHYPFSNVSDFTMCTGSNKLPVYKKASALSNLPHYLLTLPNNDDYYNVSYNKLNLVYRELLEHLKDKSPEYYYTDILVKSKHTLKDFI